MRSLFMHTEGQAQLMLVVIFGWLAYAIYFTQTFKLHPIASSAATAALLALMRWVSAGPAARFLPGNARSCFDFKNTALESRPWAGKVAVVTGACGFGMGFETVKQVALLGAHVVMVDMVPKTVGEAAMKQIKKEDKFASLVYVSMDQSDLASIGKAAQEIVAAACKIRNSKSSSSAKQQCIDFLVNNAGRAARGRQYSREGYDVVFQTNYLGAYVLTEWLLPHIVNGTGRIVNLASVAHTWLYIYPTYADAARRAVRVLDDISDPTLTPLPNQGTYSVSKFCNLLHACTLAKRLEKRQITAASCHPGAVWSNIWQFIPYPVKYLFDFFMLLLFKRPIEGSQTALHCLTAGNIVSGGYYADCGLFRPRDEARDETVWEAVDEWTKKAVGKYLPK